MTGRARFVQQSLSHSAPHQTEPVPSTVRSDMQYWLAFSWPYNLLSNKVLRITVYSCANAHAGPCTAGFCRDTRAWRCRRRDRRGLACASASDVCMVASGARGDVEALDVSLLYDATALRGGAAFGSGESVWGGQDRRDLSGD